MAAEELAGEAPTPGPSAVPADDPRLKGLRELVWVMDRLRGEGGCPWDREQTHASLRGYLLEEAYELIEALDEGDDEAIREELGDVLFQVVFHARVAEDGGRFHLGDAGEAIARKLYRRHPHVFQPGESIEDPREVERAWQAHKLAEGRRSVLEGIPASLPALLRSQRLQEKAAAVGFDWPNAEGPRRKIDEELSELDEALTQGDPAAIAAELGDLLFSAVNLARHLGLDAEAIARESSQRFEARFRQVEDTGGDLANLDAEALDRLWEAAKRAE